MTVLLCVACIDKLGEKVNADPPMMGDNRKTPRFRDFARAKLAELCQFTGFLEDVSKTGCRVRFSNIFELDPDQEYTLTVLPALRSGIPEFSLTVRPQWVQSDADFLEIGFTVLHSPGLRYFSRYVDMLAELEAEPQEA